MRYNELNVFGAIIKPGHSARLAFDDDFRQVRSETGAAHVLEFTLGNDGNVYVRLCGASRLDGVLMLYTLGQGQNEVPMLKGRVHRLVQRFNSFLEIKVPGRVARMTFQEKCYAGGRNAFELNWSAIE